MFTVYVEPVTLFTVAPVLAWLLQLPAVDGAVGRAVDGAVLSLPDVTVGAVVGGCWT